MGAVLYGNQPCIDPVKLAADLRVQQTAGFPVDLSFVGRANSFRCPLGQSPGQGWILLSRASLDALNVDVSYPLVFGLASQEISGAASPAQSVSLGPLVLVRGTCLSPGLRGDPDAPYLVELADRRRLAMASVIDAAYNLRSSPGSSPACYLSATLNGGSPWTWATMATAVWNAVGQLGAFPGLPFTPDGTPEGFNFYGENAYESLGVVLERLGCALKYDPTKDAFSVVQVAVTDATNATALTKYDGQRVWDSDVVESAKARLPQYVRVYFPVQRTVADAAGGSPYYHRDQTDPTAGGPLSGTLAGTYAPVYDDLAAVYDDLAADYDGSGTLTNASALASRAAERAADYFRRARQLRLLRSLIGPRGNAGLLPAAQVQAATWRDHGAGCLTDVERTPAVEGVWPFPESPQEAPDLTRRVLAGPGTLVRPTGFGKRDTVVVSATGGAGAPGIQNVTVVGSQTVALDPTTDWLVVTSVGGVLAGLIGGTADRPLLIQNVGPDPLTVLNVGLASQTGKNVVLKPGDFVYARHNGGWKLALPDYRVLTDNLDTSPDYLFNKVEAGVGIAIDVDGPPGNARRTRFSATGEGSLLVTNVTDVTVLTVVNNTQVVNYNSFTGIYTAYYYVGGVWYQCCTLIPVLSGSGSGGSGGGTCLVPVTCCAFPVPCVLHLTISAFGCPAIDGLSLVCTYDPVSGTWKWPTTPGLVAGWSVGSGAVYCEPGGWTAPPLFFACPAGLSELYPTQSYPDSSACTASSLTATWGNCVINSNTFGNPTACCGQGTGVTVTLTY